jgi:hypothetical protein
MADKMTTYRIIGKNSFGTFTHGSDVKSYAKAIKLLEEYRRCAPTNAYTLIEVNCTVLPA